MIKKHLVFIVMIFALALYATGCSSSGNGGSADTNPSGDTSADDDTPGDSSGPDNTSNDDSYSIKVIVRGLSGGGLTLQNNDGDDLTPNGDGTYTFSAKVADGGNYDVSVAGQPTSPAQFCNVYYHSGTVNGADVTDIVVDCVTGLYNIVDTHQTTCYDSDTGRQITCTGKGYDGDYAGNQPDYTISGDGTLVTDHVTGLVWTRTPDINGDGAVNAQDKMTLEAAEAYCPSLSYGGFTWRLPTIKELYSLIAFDGTDPSGYTGTDTSLLTPFIDDAVFAPGFGDTSAGERIIDGQYATKTVYSSPFGTIFGADTMFGVNFIDGRIKGYPYDFPENNPKTFYVLAVTGNTEYGKNSYSDNDDGTITDQATGLMWQQDDYQSENFEDGVSYCEACTTGGWTDWHLPNVKELQSIVDYTRSPDFTNSAAIDPVFKTTSFINEGGETDYGYYWAATTHLQYNGSGSNGTYISFGRALGYFSDALTDVHGAGAQRSNAKMNVTSEPGSSSVDLGHGRFYYKGPQGDILRIDNMVRCVRETH